MWQCASSFIWSGWTGHTPDALMFPWEQEIVLTTPPWGSPNVQEHVFRHWPHLIEVRPQRGQLISDLWSFRHPPAYYLPTDIN